MQHNALHKGKAMTDFSNLHPDLKKALEGVAGFVKALCGTAPTQEELAVALNRYFVKKEICDTLVANRGEAEKKDGE